MEATFWDFDGVIVDSLEEWYHIGVLAYYGIDKVFPDSQHKQKYQENCHLLYTDADEYCLLKALDHNNIQSFEKIREEVTKKEIDVYSKKFKEIRKFYQNNHPNWWCELHCLTNYGKTLADEKNTQNCFILTRKNMTDVLMLKNFFNIKILNTKVYDYSDSIKYGGKVDFIENFLNTNSEYTRAILVDDRIENLRQSSKVKCYFASWGYGEENNNFPKFTE